jgi:hypothetical protein
MIYNPDTVFFQGPKNLKEEYVHRKLAGDVLKQDTPHSPEWYADFWSKKNEYDAFISLLRSSCPH